MIPRSIKLSEIDSFVKNIIIAKLMSSTITHKTRVQVLAQQMKKAYHEKRKIRIYHGSTNSTRTQNFKKNEYIDISSLDHIIHINTKGKYALVEPNVSMDQLVQATLAYNLIPPVVMEFPGITVGGGIQGGAGESSSFKWGAFHHSCLEYEIILGNGKIVTATPDTHKDLYWGTVCSYGSLGIITRIKIKLIPAKKYVRLRYHKVTRFEDAITLVKRKVSETIDFIDGIIFSKTKSVIMTGTFTDSANLPLVTFHKASDDWFYVHAEKVIAKTTTYEEIIPLVDYLFRYNRGAFWVGRYAFHRMHLPFNRLTRFFLNPLFHTRTLYRFLQAINISQQQIIQDLCLPQEKALSFLEFIHHKTHIYPLWLCPLRQMKKKDKLSPTYLKTDLIIDIGVWGKPKGDYMKIFQFNRTLEKYLAKLNGRKVLYAHAYYPKSEFWKQYDAGWYTKLRSKYYATAVFPDIYEKTHVAQKYQVSLLKGLWDVFKSPIKLPTK